MVRSAPLLCLLAACGSFEDPNIVIDLRILAMTSTPPDQVIDVDPNHPPTASDVLDQLRTTTVCALIADPNFERRLRWEMTLCNPDNDGRCSETAPHSVIGTGILEDPDLAQPEPWMCAEIPPDGNLAGVLLDSLHSDPLGGLGGIYYGVGLRVGGEDANPDLDLYAIKNLRVMPRIPPQVTANTNPFIAHLDLSIEHADPVLMPLGRCVDQSTPLVMSASTQAQLTPDEPDGVREPYVVPTIDGKSRMFVESLTYQWIAAAGKFSTGDSGGPKDPFGNDAPLYTLWTAPKADDLALPADVPIWMIQRDERLGAHWYETCIHVVP